MPGIKQKTRSAELGSALGLEALTIAWMVVEAGGALAAGLAAHSILLMAFGIDSVIELASAGLLYRRLGREARAQPGDEGAVEALERRTARISGYLLFGLAVYV